MADLDKLRQQLRQHFEHVPPDQQAGEWDVTWKQGFTPWDRQAPSPALVGALNDKADILGSPLRNTTTRERKRAFVPGCGRGYDVLLFASYGYDAYGLDASSTAVESAEKLRSEEEDKQNYPLKDIQYGRGDAKFVLADFFKDDFLSQTGGDKFDIIYDYTFLCALHPDMRPKWAKRMSELLSPTGRLICLEYPLDKPPNTGGPPHGLSSTLYEQLFRFPGRVVNYDAEGYVVKDDGQDSAAGALVRMAHWQPPRSHPHSQGKDMMSIWRHRGD